MSPLLLYRIVPANSHRNVMSSLLCLLRRISTLPDLVVTFFYKMVRCIGCLVVRRSNGDGANPFGSSRVGALTTCARLGGGGCKAALSEATHELYFTQVRQL